MQPLLQFSTSQLAAMGSWCSATIAVEELAIEGGLLENCSGAMQLLEDNEEIVMDSRV